MGRVGLSSKSLRLGEMKSDRSPTKKKKLTAHPSTIKSIKIHKDPERS